MSPYNQGIQARCEGLSSDANPFKYGTLDFTYWWDGWCDADLDM